VHFLKVQKHPQTHTWGCVLLRFRTLLTKYVEKSGYAWNHIQQLFFYYIYVSMHNRHKGICMICVCVSISSRIRFQDIHIWKQRIWGFQIWIFIVHVCCITMHIQSLGFRGWQIQRFIHCKEWGVSFTPSLSSFSLKSFCKFVYQLVQMHFTFYLWLSTSLVLFENSCKFLHQFVHTMKNCVRGN